MRGQARVALALGVVAVAASATPLPDALSGTRHQEIVKATLRLADGTPVGQARFDSQGAGTEVSVTLRHLQQLAGEGGSFHGFHVHANDNPANGTDCVADPAAPTSTWFVSADGHFADPAKAHGEHRGDLPVVYLRRDGRSVATFLTDRFRPSDIVGRVVIVHAKPDNYGNVPVGTAANQYSPNSPNATTLTTTTGNASDRVVCGVVRRP